jgi:UDP-2-acetamido-3-amino-2,3-dideoxy-glucuronate N-acetyltransferase
MSEPNYFRHQSAFVDDGAIIGQDCRIWHFCHVAAGARIGRDCVLGQNVYVAASVVIGDGVRVQNGVSIYDGVVLEDGVFVGPSAVFTNVSNPRAEVSRKHAYERTLVQRGATIGANATIVCGHTVGSYALVGAGAVVTHDVPDYALCLGVPARRVGWTCRCGERLPLARDPDSGTAASCHHCRAAYRVERGALCAI